MKKSTLIMVIATVTLTAVSCGHNKSSKDENKPEKPKMLVVYYSQTSNTKTVAQEFATRLGADMEEIVPVNPYDGDFDATIARCLQEKNDGTVIEIKPLNVDPSKYDIIFIGFPVWFGTYAPPVATFLSQVDLSGKKIVPFCTFGSGGLASSRNDMVNAQPNANVLGGYGVRAARLAAVPKEIDQFLKRNHFVEGEYTELAEFGEPQPVSEEETAIFNAAVGDYPMIHAKAEKASSRAIPDGTEYLFIAVDLPREDNSNMPPAGEMKVYVTAVNGEAPVFTQVVR